MPANELAGLNRHIAKVGQGAVLDFVVTDLEAFQRYLEWISHLDQKDQSATHRVSIEVLTDHVQASLRALFSLNKEVQPSDEELPHFILLRNVYKPPNSISYICFFDLSCKSSEYKT